MGSAKPQIDDAERRRRLATRHHLGIPASGVAEAARALIGLHSTDPASVYLSGWARVDGLTTADVDDALYVSRSIVKHLAMRRTVWALSTDLVPMVQVAASDTIAATERRRLARDLERSGITDDGAAWVREAESAAMGALQELGPTFGRDLSSQVPMLRTKITIGSGAKAQEIGVVTRISTILSASGQATRGQAGGPWHQRLPRWTRMADWVPEVTSTEPPEAETARADLARLWLRAFGPARVDDLKWWTGWTVTHTRAALAATEAVEVSLEDGSTGFVLADDLDPTPTPEPWVALLPSLDPTPMGWKERDWYLGPHKGRLFDPNGNVGPTVWSDGHIVGGWGQRPDGEVALRFLADVDPDVTASAADVAGRLTEWLGGVVVRPSFPTPLQRELSA